MTTVSQARLPRPPAKLSPRRQTNALRRADVAAESREFWELGEHHVSINPGAEHLKAAVHCGRLALLVSSDLANEARRLSSICPKDRLTLA